MVKRAGYNCEGSQEELTVRVFSVILAKGGGRSWTLNSNF